MLYICNYGCTYYQEENIQQIWLHNTLQQNATTTIRFWNIKITTLIHVYHTLGKYGFPQRNTQQCQDDFWSQAHALPPTVYRNNARMFKVFTVNYAIIVWITYNLETMLEKWRLLNKWSLLTGTDRYTLILRWFTLQPSKFKHAKLHSWDLTCS